MGAPVARAGLGRPSRPQDWGDPGRALAQLPAPAPPAPPPQPPPPRGVDLGAAAAARLQPGVSRAQAARLQKTYGDSALAQRVAALATTSLASGTNADYAGKWRRYIEFCQAKHLEPRDARSPLLWLVSLQAGGTVAPDSAKTYMSAINNGFDTIFGLPRPSTDGPFRSDYKRVVQGWRQLDADAPKATKDERRPLPAAVAYAAVQRGLEMAVHTPQDVVDLRNLTHLAVGFALAGRASTGVNLAMRDVSVDSFTGKMQLREAVVKGKRTRKASDWHDIPLDCCDGKVVQLAQRFLSVKEQLRQQESSPLAWEQLPSEGDNVNRGEQSFWRLPWDTSWGSASSLSSSWLGCACKLLGAAPPPGQTWTSHSLRSGAASAAAALGVITHQIRLLGGWASDHTLIKHYIKQIAPCAAAYAFFGYFLPHHMHMQLG